MKRVVIVAAKRTPFGRFLGSLRSQSPSDLAAAAGEATLSRIDRSQVDQVILGNILGTGHGMNIARQVALRLKLPIKTSATTLNMMCGSGMQAAMFAVNAIRSGESNVVLAGGTESMSQAPLFVPRPGKKQAPDFTAIADTMQSDGLIDPESGQHMGQQVEDLAGEFQISRGQQDGYALRSQRLYQEASRRGAFADEVVVLPNASIDEHPRPEVTEQDLRQLKPVFRDDGSITAGNASGINDGAAMVLLAERQFALDQQWPILAEWHHGIAVGCDPSRMGLGPVHAVSALLEKAKLDWTGIDTLEINEAFAAQTLACLRGLDLQGGLSDDCQQVRTPSGHELTFNGDGGAIAVGHPLSASGARLLVHLCWKIHRGESNRAIGSLCVGGGQGIAACLTRHHEER